MAAPFTHRKLADVEDSAPQFGLGEAQEARFANRYLETEQTGLSFATERRKVPTLFVERAD